VSDSAQRRADLREMTISQHVAAAVALRTLGYKVVAKPAGVVVDAVALGSHAVGKLQPTDVIEAVNGTTTQTIAQLRTALARVRPGQTVTLTITRGSERKTVRIKTVPDPVERTRALVGFTPAQSADIKLPLKVQIDAGNVGGPSAGLAFALEVMEELGHRVDRGYRIAATGQIELDGTVSPIGGVKQKTYGVREAKADVFLVPAGDNAREARRYAKGLRIIAVKSFPQALRALATLPKKG
jgi:PDZ domain-containing protein